MRALLLVMLLVISCGKNHSSHDQTPPPDRGPVTPPVVIDPPADVSPADFIRIPDLLPTTYYIAQEKRTNCKGKYGQTTYDGSERSQVRSPDGKVIATVCTRFYRVLTMEGSAVLNSRISINYGGRVNNEPRFYVLNRCVYGEGVRRNLCLLPYHTLAADNKVHAIGDILYVPKVKGLLLPDGSVHEGYFIVRDTGGAFTGIGGKRVDMFTGLEPDYSNVFQRAGIHHKNPMEAYKIKGDSAELVKDRLKERFGDLY